MVARYWGWMALPLALSTACARKEAEEPRVLLDTHSSPALPAVEESVDVPLTELSRKDVVETVDAGLGTFLQQVEVEAVVDEGVFHGFRIVRFREPARWSGVGLLPGDVILRVNGAAIERPDQAHQVFSSLKTAAALELDYERGGQAMRLALPIVGEAAPAPAPPVAPAASSAPALAASASPGPAPASSAQTPRAPAPNAATPSR